MNSIRMLHVELDLRAWVEKTKRVIDKLSIFMKGIYEAIERRLKERVPELKCIDFESGQTERNHSSLLDYPFALIDISYPSCEDEDRYTQLTTVRIFIRLGYQTVADAISGTAPGEKREQTLRYLDLPRDVYRCLQGWDSEHFGYLSRTGTTGESRHDGLKVFRVDFETRFIEAAEDCVPASI